MVERLAGASFCQCRPRDVGPSVQSPSCSKHSIQQARIRRSIVEKAFAAHPTGHVNSLSLLPARNIRSSRRGCGHLDYQGQRCKVSSSWKKRMSVEPLPTEKTLSGSSCDPERCARARHFVSALRAGVASCRRDCGDDSLSKEKFSNSKAIHCVLHGSLHLRRSRSSRGQTQSPSSRQTVRREKTGVGTSLREWELPELTFHLHFHATDRSRRQL